MTTKRLARLLVSTLAVGAALAVLAGPTLANGPDRGVVGKQTLLAAATDEVRLLTVYRLAHPRERATIDAAIDNAIEKLDIVDILNKRQ